MTEYGDDWDKGFQRGLEYAIKQTKKLLEDLEQQLRDMQK